MTPRTLVFAMLIGLGAVTPSYAATRYMAPVAPELLLGGAVGSNVTGSGTSCTNINTPCTGTTAIGQLVPGDILVMKSGNATLNNPMVYKSTADMLKILNKSGCAGNLTSCATPITIKCDQPGFCLLDGQWLNYPVELRGASWWIVEDMNIRNGRYAAINNDDVSRHNIFRRIVAWDAAINENSGLFSIHNSNFVLFEDVGGFGTARKIFSGSQGGNDVICRRCWLRHEGHLEGGVVATTFYKSYGTTMENVLLTADAISLPETYHNSAGATYVRSTRQYVWPFAGFGVDRERDSISVPTNNTCTRTQIYGSIAYQTATSILPGIPGGGTYTNYAPLHQSESNCNTIRDFVAVTAPLHPDFNDNYGIVLQRGIPSIANITTTHARTCGALVSQTDGALCNSTLGGTAGAPCYNGNSAAACSQVSASNLTTIVGTRGNHIRPEWGTTNHRLYSSKDAMNSAGASPWQTSAGAGARICFQTVGGVTTSTKLWPWPMNDRIKAATGYAGAYLGPCSSGSVSYPNAGGCVGGRDARTEVDVTATMEALLGPIPLACRNSGAPPDPEPDPTPIPPANTFRATIIDRPAIIDAPGVVDRPLP